MSEQNTQEQDQELWTIDTVYKVVRFKFPIGKEKKTEFAYVEHSTKSKKKTLLDIVDQFEKKMQEAIAKNSDVIATNAKDDLHQAIIKQCLPTFPYAEAEEDERIAGGLELLQRDLRSFFLANGGTPGSMLLQSRQSQMLSIVEKLKDSHHSTA